MKDGFHDISVDWLSLSTFSDLAALSRLDFGENYERLLTVDCNLAHATRTLLCLVSPIKL